MDARGASQPDLPAIVTVSGAVAVAVCIQCPRHCFLTAKEVNDRKDLEIKGET